MKRVVLAAAACVNLLSARAALAQQCATPPVAGTYWSASYVSTAGTDASGNPYNTTFSVAAPCRVTIDTSFIVTVTVTDNWYGLYGTTSPNGGRLVASDWTISDFVSSTATTTKMDSGMLIPSQTIPAVDGVWVDAITTAYHGTPYNHVISFAFWPNASAHFFPPSPTFVSSLVVDPFPDSTVAPPPPPAGAAPPTENASGGCASTGSTTAIVELIALVALLAAGRRRSRTSPPSGG